jgi:hypothetical protein
MSERAARGILALAVLAYIAVFVWCSPLDTQDFPNHLTRAMVMDDLLFHHGVQFGQYFQFHFLFTSYLLGDLLLTGVVSLFGVTAAAIIWPIVTFLSLPASLFAYLRARQTSAYDTVLMLLISLYLSTDTFFIKGFTEFRLSIAFVLVAMALVEVLRRRWSVVSFAGYALVVVSTYLVHLAAVAFIAVAVGASGLWRIVLRKSRFDREALLMSPVVAVLGWHVLAAAHYRQPEDMEQGTPRWATLGGKLSGVLWDFVRYNPHPDYLLLAIFAAFVWSCLARRDWDRRAILTPRVLEPLGYAVLFLAMYFALPSVEVEASYIDVRALALVPLFLVLGLLNLPPRTATVVAKPSDAAICLAAAVAFANLAYLGAHFRRNSVWLAQYRAVVANIPERSVVLPVYTLGLQHFVHLHVASFAVMDRHAQIPYLFSGDRGAPMKYFRYVSRPYAPDELWYHARQDSDVDWAQVRKVYRYLLVMKPFDASRIPVDTRTVAESDAAALLALK